MSGMRNDKLDLPADVGDGHETADTTQVIHCSFTAYCEHQVQFVQVLLTSETHMALIAQHAQAN